MARGARNTIESGNGGNPKWTDEERQTLMLLHKLWDLTDQEVNALFHRCYPQLSTTGRDYKYDHTRDEYRFRFRKGRSKRWHEIDRPNRHNRTDYTDEENQELARIQGAIEVAAVGGIDEDEIELTPRDGAVFPIVNQPDTDAGTVAGDMDEDAEEEITETAEEEQDEDMGMASTEEGDRDAIMGDVGVEGTTQTAIGEDGEAFEEFFYFRTSDFPDDEVAGDGEQDANMADAGDDNLSQGAPEQQAFPPRFYHIDQSQFLNENEERVEAEDSTEDDEDQENEEETQEEETQEEAAPAITRRSARIREKRAA
ncbi:hypothetical protein PRZ48_008782 [Zasmidium cellare]|uniref:Uncharacterized protein n=1 Tax=Zasmidium cellare TaxID=395010 RepID=A0ABR0EHI8_ZASCE|nr:hypothetical protein PRZ48_008782 [Zasmidium cellare]